MNGKYNNKWQSLEIQTLSYTDSDISVCVATRNRSPWKELETNPFWLCLESISKQSCNNIAEVIIYDDASDDFTQETIQAFMDISHNFKIRSFKGKDQIGVERARNYLLKICNTPLAFIIDDDDILSKDSILGTTIIFSNEHNVAIVQVARYCQSHQPNGYVNDDDIAVYNPDKCVYKGNMDKSPITLKDQMGNNKHSRIYYKDVTEFGSVGLVSVKKILEVGAFPILPQRCRVKNGYGNDSEIAWRLIKNGWRITFSPQIQFHICHLRFGSNCKRSLLTLSDKETAAIINGAKTINPGGARTTSEDWCYSKITSYYYWFSRHNKIAAKKWANSLYETFVKQNHQDFYSSGVSNIDNYHTRKKIWTEAIKVVGSL